MIITNILRKSRGIRKGQTRSVRPPFEVWEMILPACPRDFFPFIGVRFLGCFRKLPRFCYLVFLRWPIKIIAAKVRGFFFVINGHFFLLTDQLTQTTLVTPGSSFAWSRKTAGIFWTMESTAISL